MAFPLSSLTLPLASRTLPLILSFVLDFMNRNRRAQRFRAAFSETVTAGDKGGTPSLLCFNPLGVADGCRSHPCGCHSRQTAPAAWLRGDLLSTRDTNAVRSYLCESFYRCYRRFWAGGFDD